MQVSHSRPKAATSPTVRALTAVVEFRQCVQIAKTVQNVDPDDSVSLQCICILPWQRLKHGYLVTHDKEAHNLPERTYAD